MILLVDNFDSFTYNLVDYFEQLGVRCDVVRNNVDFTDVFRRKYEAVVLSPGPERPEKAGQLMKVLQYYVDKLPVLGICLGHQAIGIHFGGQLIKAEKPMHGKLSEIQHDGKGVFEGLVSPFKVVRYHSLILKDIPKGFKCSAQTSGGEIMAIKHNKLPIFGIQFHPEAALTEYGLAMLKNWIIFNNIALDEL